MENLLPSTRELAEIALEAATARKRVYVEGPVGAGRTVLVKTLRELSGTQVVHVDLLQLGETDAPAVALLEASSHLPRADWPVVQEGSDSELHAAALRVGQALDGQGNILVLRLPESWCIAEKASAAESLVRNARALLNGFFASGVRSIVIADAAITPSALGYHATVRMQLPAHNIPLGALDQVTWAAYSHAFRSLLQAVPSSMTTSPLAWRLGVGAVALGATPATVRERLRISTPLGPVASLVAALLATAMEVRRAVARFLSVRRPVLRASIAELVQASDEHSPLLTECIGYGGETVRVSPVVRQLLQRSYDLDDSTGEQHHRTLAAHYASADGARSPVGLSSGQVQAWCEKAHHLALGGADATAEWESLELVAPSFYWDRARHLSMVRHDYMAAAQIYRRCVERFPLDDYGWHYLAFNLDRGRGSRDEAEAAYRRAVDLDPENPWWNSRLVAYLIRDCKPAAAKAEWIRALERVDPEGTLVRRGPWLAHNCHFWVSRSWMAAGRYGTAKAVLELVPRAIQRHGPLAALRKRIEGGPKAWNRYLANLGERPEVGEKLASLVRHWWRQLVSEFPELPLPVAGLTTDDRCFQLAWSYEPVLIEIDILRDGGVEWFAKDRLTGAAAEGELRLEGVLSSDLRDWLQRAVDA